MSQRRKGYLTLAEHDAQLKAEGRYEEMLERNRQMEAERQKRVAELERAEAPLVAELRAAGYAVESVWDLVNTREHYPEAIPILVEHLQRPYPGEIRDGIARALAIREAKFAYPILVRLWREEPAQPRTAKQGLALAASVTGYPEYLDEMIELVRDARLGPTRAFFLLALEKSKEPRAWATIMALGTDPDLGQAAQLSLKKRQRKQSGRRVPRTNE